MKVEVIEQDGEKFVVLPEDVLEQCGIGDVADISVENDCIMLKAADRKLVTNHE